MVLQGYCVVSWILDENGCHSFFSDNVNLKILDIDMQIHNIDMQIHNTDMQIQNILIIATGNSSQSI